MSSGTGPPHESPKKRRGGKTATRLKRISWCARNHKKKGGGEKDKRDQGSRGGGVAATAFRNAGPRKGGRVIFEQGGQDKTCIFGGRETTRGAKTEVVSVWGCDLWVREEDKGKEGNSNA